MCTQFCLDPCVVLSLGLDGDGVCFSASSHHLTMSVVVYDGGNFCAASDVLLAREPGYAVYLGNGSWLKDGIRDAAEGGADVDGNDEGASMALVGLACVWKVAWHERKRYKRDIDNIFCMAMALPLFTSLYHYLTAYFPLPASLRLPADDQPCIPPGDPEAWPSSARPSSALPVTVVGDMRRELDHTKSDLARSNAELSRLHDRCRRLERSLRDSRDELKNRDDEIDKLRRHLDRPILSSDSLSSTSPADDEQQARAHTADVYLTRTDTWSGAEVLQAVHDINSEILQFAAAATEACTFDRNARPSSSRAIQAMHDTSARLGPNLARILANRDHSLDPILVQLALQSCLTLCVTRALSSFCVGFPSKSDSLLHQIHHRMALAGERTHLLFPRHFTS